MSSTIYLDNSATTCVREEVVQTMLPYLAEKWGNPSSIHRLGRQSQLAVASARQQVAKLIHCEPEEIYFTPCGTYADNVAILGRARFAEANNLGRHLITSSIEHSAVLGPAKHLESQGWKVSYLPVDREGLIDPESLKKAITKETSLISIMWANNEIGSLQPIEILARIAAEAGIYFHTDAIQVTGKVEMDMAKVPISALSLSGHKFHAPKGIGVLHVRKMVNVMPLVFGGGQEKALFPGTESLANIVAIGKAAELCQHELETTQGTLKTMQEIIMKRLLAVDGVKLTGPRDLSKRLPGHVSLVVPGAEGETLVLRADMKNICISSGSACHHGIMEPSHVLKAIGLGQQDAMGSARISAGRFNTEQECAQAAEILADVFGNCPQAASACAS